MSVPVTIQFLAETDDLLRQVNQVKSSVGEMISGAGQTLSSVEAIVNRAIASTSLAAEQAEAAATQAVASTSLIATAVEQAVARAIAAAGVNVAAVREVVNQTAEVASSAVDSVDRVSQQTTQVVASRFQELGDVARSVVGTITDLAQQSRALMQPLVDSYEGALEETKGRIESVSKAGIAGFGALGASTIVAASSALSAARQYEDLQARLRGLTGSAEEASRVFQDAVAFAATTPFEVTEIVAATGTMQAFGQLSKENMEAVGNIAAATGQRLEDTALRMAKALAGTSEGFQGLRDVSGITAQRLAKYGAVLADASNVSLKGEANIRKATKALQELARVEFAGQMAQQSASLTGAMSNAGDAVTTFRATLGAGLVPVATVAARVVATLAEAATSIITPFQGLIPYVAGAALGLAAIGTAVSAVLIPVSGFIAQWIIVKATLGAADLALGKLGLSLTLVRGRIIEMALGNSVAASAILRLKDASLVLSGALGQVGARASAALPTLAGIGAGPALAGFAALSAAAVVAYIAIDRMKQSAIEADQEVTRASRSFQSAAQGFRQAENLVTQVAGKGPGFGAGIAGTIEQTRTALEGFSDLEVVNRVAAAGESLVSLEAKLKSSGEASDQAKAKIQSYSEQLSKVEATIAAMQSRGETQEFIDLTGAPEKAAELAKNIADLNIERESLAMTSGILGVFIERLSEIDPALTNIQKTAQSLDSYLKFANGLESIGQLQGALAVVNRNLGEMQADMVAAFGTIDRFQLGAKLADPVVAGNKEAVKAIEDYLARLEDRDKIQETISKKTEEQAQKEIDAHELVTARRKALGDLTLQQERARIAEQLAMVKEGTEAEVKILEQLAQKDEEIRRKREEIAKTALERQYRSIEEALDSVSSSPGATAAQTSTALEGAIASLERFGAANRAAFANAPEAAEEFRQKLVGLRNELAQSEGKELTENLKELKSTLDAGIDSNGTTVQQLVQVGEAITNLKAAIAAGSVEEVGANEYLASLEEKKLDLIQKQTAEKLKQVDEIAALQKQALDGEIEVLEARLAAGENVERQLMEARRLRTQFELDQIDEVLQREIDAGADRNLAEQKASLAREAIYRKEALSKYKAQQEPREQGSQRGRSGRDAARNYASELANNGPFSGSNSLFSGINATNLPLFASGFGESLLRDRRPQAPRFDAVVSRARVEQQNYQRQLRQQEQSSPANQTTYNTTVNVDGGSANPDARATARAAEQLARNKARQDSLMGRGPKPSMGFYGPT